MRNMRRENNFTGPDALLLTKSATHTFVARSTKLMSCRTNTKKGAQTKMFCNGKLSENREEWQTETVSFYADLYKDDSITHGKIDPEKRLMLRHLQQNRLHEIRLRAMDQNTRHPLDVPLWMMLETRASYAAKANSAPGGDGIKWGLLLSLDTAVVKHLATIFTKRINMKQTGMVSDWTNIMVKLLPKVNVANNIKYLRPISLCACLQKWYCSIVMRLAETNSTPLSESAVGFRSGPQVGEVTETLRTVLERGHAWGFGVHLLQADIRKAFDSMDHDCLITAMRDSDTPETLIHAVMQEITDCKMRLNLDGVECDNEVLMFSAGRQGATETPYLWNMYVDTASKKRRKDSRTRGLD